MSTYPDTGILLKWYYREADSTAALAVRDRQIPPLSISLLHRVEFMSAAQLKVFRGEMDEAAARRGWRLFQDEVEEGLYRFPSLDTAKVYRRAEMLAGEFSAALGTRSLDVLHVAQALELHCRDFITTDRRQAQLADACRLSVISL